MIAAPSPERQPRRTRVEWGVQSGPYIEGEHTEASARRIARIRALVGNPQTVIFRTVTAWQPATPEGEAS